MLFFRCSFYAGLQSKNILQMHMVKRKACQNATKFPVFVNNITNFPRTHRPRSITTAERIFNMCKQASKEMYVHRQAGDLVS